MTTMPDRIWEDARALRNSVLWESNSSVEAIARCLLAAEKRVREEAAKIAETEGVYPELNVFGGGPEWYQHGKRIAAAIRSAN